MTTLQLVLGFSVTANIVLGIVVVIFAIDRQYFHKTCQLRHNPIDAAIVRIEETLKMLHDLLVEHIQGGRKNG
jgi:hypothetical protein